MTIGGGGQQLQRQRVHVHDRKYMTVHDRYNNNEYMIRSCKTTRSNRIN